MKKKQKSPAQIPKKDFKFFLGSRQRYIRINCDFDSGNIDCVKQLSQFHYRLESVLDGVRTGNKVNSKSWFHFSVQGFPKNTKGKFIVNKVQTLASVYYSKYNKTYRPVYRIEGESWKRLQTQTQLVLRQTGELQCAFEYVFKSEQQKVYFAFCYPYSFSEHTSYMHSLNQNLFLQQFYFHKQILVLSPQSRPIHLLTITSHDHKDPLKQKQQLFNPLLFPQNSRPLRFNKPVVLISARVHPGETPASFTMEGVINFLVDKQDLRAYLLRKMFVFMIVPMINVDGVFHGHFRMDINGNNLNRFYINPSPKHQPAIYGIKQLANYLTKDNRLSFYFDLHAHNAKKGCFIYGNAISDFVQQVQSQVFCKLVALNHKGFEYNYCNFSQKHMKAKDQNQEMTKQGCGRVVMYRLANIIHSYSLQCGIISPNKVNHLCQPSNPQFHISSQHLPPDPCQDNKDPMYNQKSSQDGTLFTEDMYRNLGKNLLVSILDVFDKNPYNRIYNTHYKTMDMLRRLTAFEIFHHTERFRMFERFVYGKVKNINELIKEVLNQKLHYKQLYNFYFINDKQLKNVEWPDNIPGLAKPIPKSSSPSKMRRFRSIQQPKQSYEQEFYEILQQNKLRNKQQQQLTQSRALMQSQCNTRQLSLSSHSSQTQDLSPLKASQQYLSQYFPSNPIEHNFSNALISLKPSIQFNSLKLQEIYADEKSQLESPSVRVRKLLKQDRKDHKDTKDKEVQQTKDHRQTKSLKETKHKVNIRDIRDNRISEGTIFNKDHLIQSIKQDIRLEMQKQQHQKLTQYRNKQNYLSHLGAFGDKLNFNHKVRIRSTSVRETETRTPGNKIQLPALGAHFFIISSSNKAINKKV